MAEVSAILKVMPKDVEVNLDKLEAKLKALVKPRGVERMPIAFGLQALILTVIMEEAAGGTDIVEEKIKSVDGVGEVSVESVSRTIG